eukprot:5456210-Amphidinium_carterae.1
MISRQQQGTCCANSRLFTHEDLQCNTPVIASAVLMCVEIVHLKADERDSSNTHHQLELHR